MKYRTVLIDDDKNARDRLKRMLKEICAPCEIVGEASDGFEAIQIINRFKPDLVLLDIEIPGMNGIEVLRYCSDDPFVIFTTAYSDFAVKAFETNAVSYLLKPISEEKLSSSIQKLGNMHRHSVEEIHTGLSKLNITNQNTPFQVLPVKTGENIKLLSLESIICIKAESKYSIIITSQKSYLSNFSISEIEERLISPQFARVHRSYIVNLTHVVEFRKHFDKKFRIMLDIPFNEEIIVSRNYYDLLKNKLGLP